MAIFSSVDGVVTHASLTMEWAPVGEETTKSNVLFHDLVSITPPPISSRLTDVSDGFFNSSIVTGQEKLPLTFVTQTFVRQLEDAVATSIIEGVGNVDEVIFTAKLRVRRDSGAEGKVWHRFYGPITSHEQGEVTQDSIQQNTFTIDDTPLYIKSVSVAGERDTIPPDPSLALNTANQDLVYGIDKRLDIFIVGGVDRLSTLRSILGLDRTGGAVGSD